MKVLIIGIENDGAVSKIIKETLALFPKDKKYEFFCCGLGEGQKKIENNISFQTIKLPRLNDLFVKARRKILLFLKKDYYLVYWKSIYKKTSKIVKEIAPDIIVSVSGPFSYMKAGFELAKNNNLPLFLIFFDPFKDNYNIVNKQKAIEEAKKWCDYATEIFYDADTKVPVNGIEKKLTSFLIPIFESNESNKRNNEIIYGGSFYKGFREPSVLANFINAQKETNVEYKVFTDKKDSLIIQRMLINKNVSFFEPIDEVSFNKICNKALGIIVIGNANQNATIPSKVLEAIGHKKPIIGINFGKKLYYIDKYPFFFDGNDENAVNRIINIDTKALSEYDIFHNFPERRPLLFVDKLIKAFDSVGERNEK